MSETPEPTEYDGSTALKSIMQEMFVSNLFQGMNQSEAYLKAGYKTNKPEVQASKQVRKGNIKLRIAYKEAELAKKYAVDEERITRERVKIGFANIRDFMDEKGQIKPIETIDRDKLAAVAEIELDETLGTIKKFKFHNKQVALDGLSKQIGAYEADNLQKGFTLVDIMAIAAGERAKLALLGDKPLLEGEIVDV